jgi:ubiquinone biosynthesis protein
MLATEMIPTPLIVRGERPPLVIEERPPSARFRALYLTVGALAMIARILWRRLLRRLDEDSLGDLLRDYCQRMGVLWIKVGQLISMRADLAPPGVRAQLARLQDRVHGFPAEVAVRLVEQELGEPLDRCFRHFQREPLAAASIAQVHRAQLADGTWVAVKVRRPEVQRIFARDISMARILIRFLEWVGFRPEARWTDVLWELDEAMREELDYRFEATNMQRMKKTLSRHGIYVPDVFGAYSTSGVLTMEFIQGVLMSDYLQMARKDPLRLIAWREENGVRPERVARYMTHSSLRQMLEDNLFHGDLHPGNIVLLRDSRIAFLDFGSLGSMERDMTRKCDLYMQALGSRRYSKAVDIYFLFSQGLPPISLADCKTEMIRRLQAWDVRNRVQELPFEEKSFNSIQDDLVMLGAEYGVSPVWSFFRMTRAMTTMDASMRELVPRVNFHAMVTGYFRGRVRRIRSQLWSVALKRMPSLRDWRDVQHQLLDDVTFRGTIVRRAAEVFESTSSKFAQFFSHLFSQTARLLLLAGAGLAAVWLTQVEQRWFTSVLPHGLVEAMSRVPRADPQVWMLIFGAILYLHRRMAVLSKRFAEQDVQGSE